MLYFDSNHLFRLYSTEAGYEQVQALADQSDGIAVTWWARAKFASILLRKRREAAFFPQAAEEARLQFEDDLTTGAVLYDVDVRTIIHHLKNVFAEHELEEKSVIQFFRITAADGKTCDTGHYNLSAIIAVGYKVNSERAVQLRKWATGIIESFTIKGYAMDDERLKNDGSILGKKYFEEQLQRIREIRLSERKFYQKITDIYATSIDYDVRTGCSSRTSTGQSSNCHRMKAPSD